VITIRTQREWDELPELFDEFTVIEIRSEEWIRIRKTPENSCVTAMGSSRVTAMESSRVTAMESSRVEAMNCSCVEAWDYSRVEAMGSSRVEAWDYSCVEAWDSSVCDNRSRDTQIQAGDNATLYLKTEPSLVDCEDSVNIIRDFIKPSFDIWLKRGWVVADNIRQRLVSQKSLGEVTIYTTEDFLGKTFYVARLGNKFSHGKTVEEAKDDLRYKISERDKSHYEGWTLETKAKVGEMIEAYRVITGVCSTGTKMFCEGIKLKDEYTVSEVIDLTKGQYGNDEFSQFFESKKK
jgi:hypothetical protein